MEKEKYVTPESEQIIIKMESGIATSPGTTEPGGGDDY